MGVYRLDNWERERRKRTYSVTKIVGNTMLRSFGFFFSLLSQGLRRNLGYYNLVVVIHSLSNVQLSVTPCTEICQAPLSSIIFQNLLKFMSFEWVMVSSHLILFHSLLLLPSVFPSIRVFSQRVGSSYSEGWIIGALILPVDIQGWLPSGLMGPCLHTC